MDAEIDSELDCWTPENENEINGDSVVVASLFLTDIDIEDGTIVVDETPV